MAIATDLRTFTGKGRELAMSTDIDDYDSVHYGLTLMMAKDNAFVWVKQDGWENPETTGRMEFFAITSPLNLTAFKSRRVLGDELRKSVTAKIWGEKWGVEFRDLDFPRAGAKSCRPPSASRSATSQNTGTVRSRASKRAMFPLPPSASSSPRTPLATRCFGPRMNRL